MPPTAGSVTERNAGITESSPVAWDETGCFLAASGGDLRALA